MCEHDGLQDRRAQRRAPPRRAGRVGIAEARAVHAAFGARWRAASCSTRCVRHPRDERWRGRCHRSTHAVRCGRALPGHGRPTWGGLSSRMRARRARRRRDAAALKRRAGTLPTFTIEPTARRRRWRRVSPTRRSRRRRSGGATHVGVRAGPRDDASSHDARGSAAARPWQRTPARRAGAPRRGQAKRERRACRPPATSWACRRRGTTRR